MTESTDDANKATHDKALKASVATLINSTMQSGPTIHTAAHVGVRTCISPTHTQQVKLQLKRLNNEGHLQNKTSIGCFVSFINLIICFINGFGGYYYYFSPFFVVELF